MRNEVYGELKLDVSVGTVETNEELAMLQAAYEMCNLKIKRLEVKAIMEDDSVEEFKVHNWNMSVEKYFGEDE